MAERQHKECTRHDEQSGERGEVTARDRASPAKSGALALRLVGLSDNDEDQGDGEHDEAGPHDMGPETRLRPLDSICLDSVSVGTGSGGAFAATGRDTGLAAN